MSACGPGCKSLMLRAGAAVALGLLEPAEEPALKKPVEAQKK